VISLFVLMKRLALAIAFNVLELAAGIIMVLCLTERPAKAYADPGSGALMWQLIFASVVSLGFHFRKLRVWFARHWPRRRDPTG
jgi:hypothetical protein